MKFSQNQDVVKSSEQFEKGCFPMRGWRSNVPDVHAGVKVEIKRRWNYKIPWAPHKIFWAPYLFHGPLYVAVETMF